MPATNQNTSGQLTEPIRGASFLAGGGSGSIGPSGILNLQTNTLGNGADTTEDTLHTFVLPANTLGATGAKRIRISGSGQTATNGDTKTLKVYFGTASVTIASAVAASNKPWNYVVDIYFVSAGNQNVVATGQFNAALVADLVTTMTQVETGALTLKSTAQAGTGNANDLTETTFCVEVF